MKQPKLLDVSQSALGRAADKYLELREEESSMRESLLREEKTILALMRKEGRLVLRVQGRDKTVWQFTIQEKSERVQCRKARGA